ncbi:MAG: hypothetical protein QM692_23010 [Thermomicrobiales bacterium]
MSWGPDELIIEFSPDYVELRVRVDQDGPDYRDFSLQLVAIIEGEYFPVMLYDCSHGAAPHRDVLNWDGTTLRKTPVWSGLSYREAFNHAYDDLAVNWERYVDSFIRRRP